MRRSVAHCLSVVACAQAPVELALHDVSPPFLSYPPPSPGVCLFLPFRPPALQLAQRVLAAVQQQASPVEAVEVDGGDVAELGGNGRNSAQEHHLQLVPGNKWRACVWEWSGWVGEDKMCRSAAGLCHGKLVWQQLTASLHKTVATVSYSF